MPDTKSGELLQPAHRPGIALATALMRFRALERNSIGRAQSRYCREAATEILASLELHEPELFALLRQQYPHLVGDALLAAQRSTIARKPV